jgi:hypothetical protein
MSCSYIFTKRSIVSGVPATLHEEALEGGDPELDRRRRSRVMTVALLFVADVALGFRAAHGSSR